MSGRLKCSFVLLLWMLVVHHGASAHEGHQHPEVNEARDDVAAMVPPRLALSAPPLELVAVRESEALVIWVDDYDSNVPRTDLTLHVREGVRTLQAQLATDGSYRLPADLFEADQALALEFLVQDARGEQRLRGLLPAAAPIVAGSPRFRGWEPLLLAATGLLLALVLAVRRHRRLLTAS